MSFGSTLPQPQLAPDRGYILLKDGGTARVRPVQRSDEPLLRQMVQSLRPETLLNRFFAAISVDAAVNALLIESDYYNKLALCAVRGYGDDQRIIAVGAYVKGKNKADSAEVAFLVSEEEQGRGIGTALLERLAILALQHAIKYFTAVVRAENIKMLEVFRESGFSTKSKFEGGEVEVVIDLTATEDSISRFEARERLSTVQSLIPIFRPRSIAVVGASRDKKSFGRRIFDNLVLGEFEGPVYPVNRSARVIGSHICYPSILDLPEVPDLCVIAVPRDGVLEVVRQCGEKGVRALVIITTGFAETGPEGKQIQENIVNLAHGLNMRVVGPNCLGVINTVANVHMNASFAPHFPPPGGVAMSSQSGALGLALLEYTRRHGLGISSFISVGNKADVSGNDLLLFWEEDPDTDLIILYLESFGNPRRFARLARRVTRKKPVLVVKAARTAAGLRAAQSHTAALASSEAATDALFKQTGVIRADTLEELFDFASFLARQPLPNGPRVGIVTNAGGPGILAADALAAYGMEVPTPSHEAVKALSQSLPKEASLKNPIDMVAAAGPEEYAVALEAVLHDPQYDSVMVIFIPLELSDPQDIFMAIRRKILDARAEGIAKPVVAVVMSPEPASTIGPGDVNVPVYSFPESAAKALATAWQYRKWLAEPEGKIPVFSGIDYDKAKGLISGKEGWLDPSIAFALLELYGLRCVPTKLAKSVDEAKSAASEIGFPVAVKLYSTTILHKSDLKGVFINLDNEEEVEAACKSIEDSLKDAGRSDELEGFIVQKMAESGVETFMGITQDPIFGPVLGFGLGGIEVEALGDVTFRVLPVTDRDASAMLTSLRGKALLEGFRGRPPVDKKALEDAILRLAHLAETLPQVKEVDLNPVIASQAGMGIVVVDARIRVGY